MVLTLLISMASVFAITGTAAQSSDIDIWDGSVSTSLSGSGTANDPYLIQSGADLAYLSQEVNNNTGDWNTVSTYNKYYKLTKSIDLNNIEWTPIGKDYGGALASVSVFSGFFDGDGHRIYNLICGSTDEDTNTAYTYTSYGLFGGLCYGKILNVGIESGTIYINNDGPSAGGIVARVRVNTTVSNCYSKVNIVRVYEGACNAGGIVGVNHSHGVTIENCVYYGSINCSNGGTSSIGGICAYTYANNSGSITMSNCYNLGDVIGNAGATAGGLIGNNAGTTKISNSHSSGVVSGIETASGYLIGNAITTGTYANIVAYTSGYANTALEYLATKVSCGSATVTATINTTDTLVVPTESIFEDFLVATTYGATLGAVEKYDDITEYRGETYTAPVKDGFVFAGWFIDARCTTALGADVKDGAAYAKFVDADALTVNFQVTAGTTAESETTNLRLLTTVESTDLACVGFIITYGEKTLDAKLSTTVYKSVKGSTAADTFTYGPQYFSGVSEYFATYSITDVPTVAFDQTFTVVPTWTTLDGTVVEGAAANVVISDSFAG